MDLINRLLIVLKRLFSACLLSVALTIPSFAQVALPPSNGLDTASFNTAFEKLNFNAKGIVVIGEAHKMRSMFTTEIFIIENLAKKGYKTLLLECGKSEAQIINMYMQTGDTAILKHTRAKEPDGDYRRFLQSLYELKRRNNYTFVFKGFDFERPRSTSYLFATWFDTAKIDDNSFKQHIAPLLTIRSSNIQANMMKEVFAEEEIFENIRNHFPKFETQYRKVLKDNFGLFKDIIFNPAPFGDAVRDSNMNSNIISEEKAGNLSKAIIIVGSYHVCNDSTRLIPLLSKTLSEKFSLTVFALIYSNCRNFNEDKRINSEERFLKYLEKKQTDKPVIDFKLDTLCLIPMHRKNSSTIIMGFYNQ
jgi:hypothetical protein